MGADGSQYENHGVIFASATTIYLFGGLQLSQPDMPIKPGLAMGLVAIPMRSIDRRSFPGLQLGHDGVEQTFSSRLVFKQTKHKHSLKMPVASIARDNAKAKLGNDPAFDRLANRVNILRDDVLVGGQRANGDRLRDEVGSALNPDPSALASKLPEGNPFNPSESEHLPFNTALSMLPHLPQLLKAKDDAPEPPASA